MAHRAWLDWLGGDLRYAMDAWMIAVSGAFVWGFFVLTNGTFVAVPNSSTFADEKQCQAMLETARSEAFRDEAFVVCQPMPEPLKR